MREKIRILIIDDDQELCSIIEKYLRNAEYTVDISYTGAGGLNMALTGDYHLIVLDIMLPQINGLSILTEIRKQSVVPVLMLTAKNEESDKVRGLQLGADDYLTKPFSMAELMARIDSLVRRYTTFNRTAGAEKTLNLKHLTLDTQTRVVLLDNKVLALTGKEFELLYFLAAHKGQIFTKRQIYQQVLGDEYAFDDSNIMSFISKLRKKIEADAAQPFFIQTVRGVGYRFNQEG
ncbi:response regulator transcription factor [Candidatus Enterococcus murrayae]|uniref:Response regulator transcription factor n=1 Tax=Candidatus Enterococcus murrayae TaxID=2815321 RepID=A0ABS3HDP7_9ENTE|nr:response regulator transcription factor [Enterococcus sp. MJM16]MBO0451586.1 response regulator transcription factor [Enterococcus sp. MJM16]